MATDDATSKLDSFWLMSQRYLRGKYEVPGLRQTVDLAIAEQCLRPHLTEPAAIAALDAAARFARGEIDKKQLAAARKPLLRRMDEIEKQPSAPAATRILTRTCYFATLISIKPSDLDSMVHMIINGIVNKEHSDDPSTPWNECQERVGAAQNRRMVRTLLGLLPKQQRAEWRRIQTRRYVFDDPRFAREDLQDMLIYRDSLGAPAAELNAVKKALDAFQKCQGAELIDRGRIQPIVEISVCSISRARKVAFELLAYLAPYSDAVRDALLNSLRHRSGAVRFEAVSIVGFYKRPHPLSFLLAFFEDALGDRSPKVRLFASQECVTQRRPELVPLLDRFAARETDEDVKSAMIHDAGLLRDGFYAHEDPARREIVLSVLLPNGYARGRVPREKFATMTQKDLEKEADAVRKDAGY